MDLTNERKLAARAKNLGESADPAAINELVQLSRSGSPLVRRLAASAIGKLAGIVPADIAVSTLQPLLQDGHPQVRQYAAKALGSFGPHAGKCLPDLRDMYRNPEEKDYVKRSVASAGKIIREALRIAENTKVRKCARCSAPVSPDEYKIGMLKKQKVYQMTGKRLISLYAADKPRLDEILKEKLSKYMLLEKP